MARNIAAAGHNVRAWNRTISRARHLAEDGVRVEADAADAVRDADAVVTMVLDGAAVQDVMQNVAPAMREGAVWVQSTTVGPAAQSRLAALARERGLIFFDAPVWGTRTPAETGQLTVLAAGPAGARPVAQAVFDAVGRTTLWVGEDAGAGPASSLKLVLNSWVVAVTNTGAEVMALAKGLEVDPDQFFAAIAGGPLDLPYLRNQAASIRDGNATLNFSVDAALKDSRLVVDAGEQAGVPPGHRRRLRRALPPSVLAGPRRGGIHDGGVPHQLRRVRSACSTRPAAKS